MTIYKNGYYKTVEYDGVNGSTGRAGRLTQEFDSISEEIRATMAATRVRLLEKVQLELQALYRDVLSVPDLEAPTAGSLNLGASSFEDLTPFEGVTQTDAVPVVSDPVRAGQAKAEDLGMAPTGEQTQKQAINGSKKPETPVVELKAKSSIRSPRVAQVEGSFELFAQPLEDEIYEGTVGVSVNDSGSVRQLLDFVHELSQSAQLRLLRLVGNRQNGLDLWVGLRQPLCLEKVLLEMKGVAQVSKCPNSGLKDNERRIKVYLTSNS